VVDQEDPTLLEVQDLILLLDHSHQLLEEEEQIQILEMEVQVDLAEDRDLLGEDLQDLEYQVKEILVHKEQVEEKAAVPVINLLVQDTHTQSIVDFIHEVVDMVTTQVITHNQLTRHMVAREEALEERVDQPVQVL
jgi:undecaprenyl pyrophosphate synthase